MSACQLVEQSSQPSTPSAGTVKVYVDNTATPNLKILDDSGTARTAADGSNTKTLSNKTFVAPNIGAATGTSLAVTGAVTSSGTAGMGYATGAGGTVTQLTSKSTGVTLDKICGQITTHNAALAAAAEVSFVLTNSTIAATDLILVNMVSGGTVGAYAFAINAVGSGTCTMTIANLSAGSLSEALVLNFLVLKAVAA